MSSKQFRLNCAIESNDFELTKELLNDANPAHNEYYAIRIACKNQNQNILTLLLNDSRVSKLKARLIIKQTRNQKMIDFFESLTCSPLDAPKP